MQYATHLIFITFALLALAGCAKDNHPHFWPDYTVRDDQLL